jgi:predicted amidohydrolase YtcJ
MILYGRFQTMNAEAIGAVYIGGGYIADVGSLEDLAARYPGAKRYRFESISPGLHDAHTHPLQWGEQLDWLDLSGLTTPQAVARVIAEKTLSTPPGEWIKAAGYLLDSYPDHTLLSQAAPHHPVLALSRDFHSGWTNALALTKANITAQTPDPAQGRVLRDQQGEPTGYLLEEATALVQRCLPEPGLAELERGLEDLAKRGYTATHHMGWCPLELAKTLAASQRLPLKLWWAMDKNNWQDATPGWHGNLNIAAVKFFADGALGSRTAWMHEAYAGGGHGMPLDTASFIHQEGQKALDAGFTLAVHAIGTKAVQAVLEVFHSLRLPPKPAYPLRLEHVQHVQDPDLQLFSLPMALSLQPMHALGDAALIEKHTPGRWGQAFRFRDLWNTGLPLAFGSDAPVAKPHWQDNLAAALTINPEQALTAQEVLWAHTRGAALAANWSGQGHIHPGSWADLTLWEQGKIIGRVFEGVLQFT